MAVISHQVGREERSRKPSLWEFFFLTPDGTRFALRDSRPHPEKLSVSSRERGSPPADPLWSQEGGRWAPGSSVTQLVPRGVDTFPSSKASVFRVITPKMPTFRSPITHTHTHAPGGCREAASPSVPVPPPHLPGGRGEALGESS